jgi:Zn-dependent peptidase ImmA (M78 family)
MHELAHISLRHVPSRVDLSVSGLMLLSDYPDQQEQEAEWLAGAMLLPRAALIHHRSRGWGVDQICAKFSVSATLCQWRIRMTGVDSQLKRRGATELG